MRLLLVAESRTTHTHKWAQHFRRSGAEVLVVSQSAEPVKGTRVVEFPPSNSWWSRLPRQRLGGGWQRWLAGWPMWRRLLAEFDPDIVHIYYTYTHACNYFYYRGIRNLVVSTLGSDVVFDQPPPRSTVRRLRSLMRQARVVTATGEFLAGETRRFLDAGRSVQIIAFGVDCERFTPRPDERSETGPPVLIFVKQLERKYGPDILIEAFAEIQARKPEAQLVIVGGGSLRAELEAQVLKLGLEGQVTFKGRVPPEGIPALLQSSDIFVMPSVCQESFGVAALEASACGLPVVASHVGGIPETVVDTKTGILVPRRDPGELANACLKLIEQPELRNRLGKAGREFVLSRYRWEHTAKQMEAVYASLLEKD